MKEIWIKKDITRKKKKKGYIYIYIVRCIYLNHQNRFDDHQNLIIIIYQIRKTLRKFRRSKQEQYPGMKEIYGVFWFDVKDIGWGMENKLFELAKVLKKDYILIAVYNRKEQKVKLMPPFLHSKQKSKYVRMRRELLDIVEVVEEKEEEIENETGDGKQ